jgi:D-alanyl-D-alanine carboxypeptidase
MSENRQIPRYLIVLFLAILTLVGIGIYKTTRHHDGPSTGQVLGVSTEKTYGSAPLIKFIPVPQPLKTPLPSPYVNAKNMVLLDSNSKFLLFSQGQNEQVPVASLTKVMTATLVIDSGKLDEVVTLTPEDLNVIGSHIGFVPGEKIKVSELLKALLIMSSNEAGMALARTVAGSVPTFVEQMNERARTLGLTQTSYDDPHGLSAKSLSSAFDQAILFNYALNYPVFREIISLPQVTAVSVNGLAHDLKNSNRLVTDEMHMDGIIGGKTGYTPEAGHCLVSAVTRDSHTIIAVILNTASPLNTASAVESKKLLEWGFANYSWPLN